MSETKLVDFESARISQIKRANANDTANALSAKGFVMIHRKIKQTSFYKDSEATHLFIHLLMDATYKPSVITINGKEIALNRGQLVTGRNELSYETGISVDRIKYLLSKLKKHGVITVDANRHYSIVSIVNYDSYQWSENGQNSAEKVPSKFHQSANANQEPAKLSGEVVPSECHQSATINKLINNNISNTNVLDMSSHDDQTTYQNNSKPKKRINPRINYQEYLDAYNEVISKYNAEIPEDSLRPNIPMVKEVNSKRKGLLKALIPRLKTQNPDGFKAYINAFFKQSKPFYLGENNRNWTVHFDFFLRETTLTGVRESQFSR